MTLCPNCAGSVVTVIARAWCIKPYADGGCGGHWVHRGGKWRLRWRGDASTLQDGLVRRRVDNRPKSW